MKIKTFYSEKVTNNLMDMLEERAECIQAVLESKEVKKIRFEERDAMINELAALVDVMNYIDSQRKTYIEYQAKERLKVMARATLKSIFRKD